MALLWWNHRATDTFCNCVNWRQPQSYRHIVNTDDT